MNAKSCSYFVVVYSDNRFEKLTVKVWGF